MTDYRDLFRFTGSPITGVDQEPPLDDCMFLKGYVVATEPVVEVVSLKRNNFEFLDKEWDLGVQDLPMAS